MAVSRRNKQGRSNLERRLHPAFQSQTQAYKAGHHNQRLYPKNQKTSSETRTSVLIGQKRGRKGQANQISSLFQSLVLGPQTKQQMATNPRSQCPQQIFEDGYVQNGNPREYKNISRSGGVGHLNRFPRCIFPYSHPSTVQKIPEIPFPRTVIPISSSTLRSVHSSNGIYDCDQRGKTYGPDTEHKNISISGQLIGQVPLVPRVCSTHKQTNRPLPRLGLGGRCQKIRTHPQTSVRLCGVPIRPQTSQGKTYPGQVANLAKQNSKTNGSPPMSSTTVDVSTGSANSHRKIGSHGKTPHETPTVALKEQLENPRVHGKINSHSKIHTWPPPLVATGRAYSPRAGPTPFGAFNPNFHRRLKGRLGCTPGRPYVQRHLVYSREQIAYQCPRVEGSSPDSKEIPTLSGRKDSSSGHRQHHSGCLYKQARGHEIGVSVCSLMEADVLVRQERGDDQSPPHTGQAKCHSRQIVTARSNHTNRMVTATTSVSNHLSDMAHSPGRLVCNQIQQQATPVRLCSSRPQCLGGRRPEPDMEGHGSVCLSSHSPPREGAVQDQGQSMSTNDCYSTRMAQDALVLGPSGNGISGATLPTQCTRSPNTTVQSGSTRQSVEPKPTCMAPRTLSVREQGFSKEVANRIEAPQRVSTRSVYDAKWSVFARWCQDNQVDIGAPPLKSIADFLLYLFQERNLQPSTIDGYRSAIADKLGNEPVNISKNENITRLLDSFHRDKPKGRRGVPSWNLSLVLHQLTKPPFEPLGEASLKHLTFKTVFLMALASGKRGSEIHAWKFKNIRNQADWTNVSMYPSASFLSKNQLARDGPGSVAPVVIPALGPTLDSSLREDRTLCPVRALKYYMKATSQLRDNKELVFVSFKKGFSKDISPSTISS